MRTALIFLVISLLAPPLAVVGVADEHIQVNISQNPREDGLGKSGPAGRLSVKNFNVSLAETSATVNMDVEIVINKDLLGEQYVEQYGDCKKFRFRVTKELVTWHEEKHAAQLKEHLKQHMGRILSTKKKKTGQYTVDGVTGKPSERHFREALNKSIQKVMDDFEKVDQQEYKQKDWEGKFRKDGLEYEARTYACSKWLEKYGDEIVPADRALTAAQSAMDAARRCDFDQLIEQLRIYKERRDAASAQKRDIQNANAAELKNNMEKAGVIDFPDYTALEKRSPEQVKGAHDRMVKKIDDQLRKAEKLMGEALERMRKCSKEQSSAGDGIPDNVKRKHGLDPSKMLDEQILGERILGALSVPAAGDVRTDRLPTRQFTVKGRAQDGAGKPLAGAILTRALLAPTPSDFVAGADPGWDKRKDVQPSPFDISRNDGSYAVTLPGVPGMVPVSDAPVKDMIVTLDTRDQYIARLKRNTDSTKFVKDHGLEDGSRIISIPPDGGGGALVIYRVQTDQKEARSLQDAISKDERVADTEPDDCREIQSNGSAETYTPADSTVVAAKDCETTPVVEPVKERPCGAIAGNVYDTRPTPRKRIVVYLAADCTRCVPDKARGSYQVTLTSGPGFDPSFLAIPAGSSVVLTSGEVKEIDHFPYVVPAFKEDREANRSRTELGLLSKEQKKTVLFSEPDAFVVHDDFHKFEDLRVFVTPNACFVVVADDGTYKISEVPPGAYDIKVWTSPKRTHFPEAQVVVHPGKTTIQDLVLER